MTYVPNLWMSKNRYVVQERRVGRNDIRPEPMTVKKQIRSTSIIRKEFTTSVDHHVADCFVLAVVSSIRIS